MQGMNMLLMIIMSADEWLTLRDDVFALSILQICCLAQSVPQLMHHSGTSESMVLQMIDATMQYSMRHFDGPLMQHYQMRQAHMHYNHLDCNVYSDTFFSDVKSL
jgi:hypothetical protein